MNLSPIVLVLSTVSIVRSILLNLAWFAGGMVSYFRQASDFLCPCYPPSVLITFHVVDLVQLLVEAHHSLYYFCKSQKKIYIWLRIRPYRKHIAVRLSTFSEPGSASKSWKLRESVDVPGFRGLCRIWSTLESRRGRTSAPRNFSMLARFWLTM
jgi:hypothetical protein